MYDAVYVYAIGLQTLGMSHRVPWLLTNTSCRAESPWPEGLSLINYINSVGASSAAAVQLTRWAAGVSHKKTGVDGNR